ncbi:MAG: DMT family transporter [Bacteroidetes bacterium]|nr:MAG: DMT family transporter [Bacteroidota bacterium]
MRASQLLTFWLLFAFLALVWGSSFILMKRGLEAFSPLQIAAIRMTVAAVILLPFVIRNYRPLTRKEWIAVAVVGIFGNGLPAFFFPLAETRISSAGAGILNSLSPLFVLVLGALFFRRPFSSRQLAGIGFGFGGALMLMLSADGQTDIFSQAFYSLIIVFSTIGYGLSTIVTKTYLSEQPATVVPGLALLMVSIPYSIYLFGFSHIGEVMNTDPEAWASLGYVMILGAVGTALALVLFYRLIQQGDPVLAASVTYVIPIVAVGWGLLDKESFNFRQVIGMLLILVGLWLVNRKN